MIFSGVPAEQEAVVLQDVSQGERLRGGGGLLAGQDPVRARAGQQRADGQAQLVQQARRGDLGQQARTPLGEHPPVAALGQRADGRLQVHGFLSGHDDVGPLFQGGAAVGRGLRGGDDDRASRRRGHVDDRAGRLEVEPRGDHRDRWGRGPA
jgi:hypothetical protein